MRSLDQQRAAYAWDCVTKTFASKDNDTTYTNLALSAPALVMGNGLMQTLAFFEKKGGEAKELNIHIFGWLAKHFKETDEGEKFAGANFAAVMTVLQNSESDLYLQATDEVLELLRWIRQLAAAKAKG